MAKNDDIQKRITSEVSKRVSYYEAHEPDKSTFLKPVDYIAAAVLALIGLAMIIIGAL